MSIAIAIFAVVAVICCFGSILIFISQLKFVKSGYILVVRSQTGDRVIRKGGAFVIPFHQEHAYVPMDVFEVQYGNTTRKVCVNDDDESVMKFISRVQDLELEAAKNQIVKSLSGITEDSKAELLLAEYGVKIVT